MYHSKHTFYRAYRIFFISKKHFRTEIQLGIDGEKIEIDPLQQKASIIFKASVKAIHYSVDSVAWCRISVSNTLNWSSRRGLILFSHLRAGSRVVLNSKLHMILYMLTH